MTQWGDCESTGRRPWGIVWVHGEHCGSIVNGTIYEHYSLKEWPGI